MYVIVSRKFFHLFFLKYMVYNKNKFYDDQTPMVMLSVEQLKDVMWSVIEEHIRSPATVSPVTPSSPSYVYGLAGIQELFGVSHTTAQKLKDGILAPAVIQNGRKIVVDREKAIELFNNHKR